MTHAGLRGSRGDLLGGERADRGGGLAREAAGVEEGAEESGKFGPREKINGR